MSRLDDFLNLPNVAEQREQIYVNSRLGTVTIKPMTVQEHKSYQDRCKGKINKGGTTFDSSKFNVLIVANQVVDPNLADADFLKKAGYPTAVDFINAKFYSGEVSEIARKVCEISGFDLDPNEEIEEAKN